MLQLTTDSSQVLDQSFMATKKFVMEIPLLLHDMVQEFVVSALSARPSNYVDFAVEYYMQLQTKEDRVVYETVGVNSIFRSGQDSDELCGEGEAVSDTANVYQVSIRPEAFQSLSNKQVQSDDDSISADILCSDRKVPMKTHSPVFLNQQPGLNPDTNSLVINSTHTLPTSPPFTFSFQGNSFNVSSTTNSVSLVPITSPIVTSTTTNLPFNFSLHSPQSVNSKTQLNSVNNKPTTPLPSNSPISLHVLGERNSPHSSTFTSPLKNNFTGLSLNNGDYMQPLKDHQNHFECKSCRGVFKPHPRPAVQPFLSVPNSPVGHIQSHSNLSHPERPQLYSILPTSHIPPDTYSPASSSTTYFATSTQPTPTKKLPDLSERKFHCPICERSYKSNTGLKRHLIVHSGERPFQCHYCFKSFYRKYVLTTHISRVHNKIFATSQS